MITNGLNAVDPIKNSILAVAVSGLEGQEIVFIDTIETLPEDTRAYAIHERVFLYLAVNWNWFPYQEKVVEFFRGVLAHPYCPPYMKVMLASGVSSCGCKFFSSTLYLLPTVAPYGLSPFGFRLGF